MPTQPVDPLTGPRYALEGKVVTMDDKFTVLERGVVYVDAGQIVAVEPTGVPTPPGFDDAPMIRTGGTIYPGLIELHNHLSYNILPLWDVPERFDRREQWRSHSEKRRLVTGPMAVLGKTPQYVEAIVRYVECKCLVAGVTTSQGLSLYGVGIQPYYRGVTRNVEDTDDPALPEARTRIPDVEAEDATKFFEQLKKKSCLLLHMSEGVDDRSREHFEALHLPSGEWAITPALAGIHCAALSAKQFQVMGQHGGSMIWSPLSNLLLYGGTADVQAVKDAGVLMGIGADWSPSGSKNLLYELKVAHVVSELSGGVFTKAELLALATINAAKILKWDKVLGSVEAGKRADLLVVDNRAGDPYDRLLEAKETSIILVVINGVPRYGQKRLMKHFGEGTEELAVGHVRRVLNLRQDPPNSLIGDLTLDKATARLKDGLHRLRELALALEEPGNAMALLAGMVGTIFERPSDAVAEMLRRGYALDAANSALAGMSAYSPDKPIAFLELDQDELVDEASRIYLPGAAETPLVAAVPYSELLESVVIDLDPLTVADDRYYFGRLKQQKNLPEAIKTGLLDFCDAIAESPPVLPPPPKEKPITLATFRERPYGYLSLADRLRIVEQALVLMEEIYVHLPLKQSMHAVDPVQRLKLLQYRLQQESDETLPPELDFHKEMISIFSSTRDLHTNYLLPRPFSTMTAYLPFFVEEYYEHNVPRYIVSKVQDEDAKSPFKPGVEILHWNGIPIRQAIEINADKQAGSNPAARHARGLDSLTIRPMIRVLPPDEDWVTIHYRALDGKVRTVTKEWLVFQPESSLLGVDPDSGVLEATALGFDLQTDAVLQTKKSLYAREAVKAEKRIAAEAKVERAAPPQGLDTSLPTTFRAGPVKTKYGTFGHIRIFTFNTQDADAFVNEFVRLAQLLPQNGLIIDVRGNGGGLIYAAERLLQVLTPRRIEPERTQFINTPLTLKTCEAHAPSSLWADFDLGPWVDSIAQAVESGATYSRSFPITSPESCNTMGQKYFGPVLLIADALCYSATDIFAAGFRDHGIGPILGTSDNTGAGGANVWTHRLLQMLLPQPDSVFKPLPYGTGMRVAVRRTLRVGEQAGVPVEDFGVHPDPPTYQLTKDDLLKKNCDLMDAAGKILASRKVYNLSVGVEKAGRRKITVTAKTQNISWLDPYLLVEHLDERPLRDPVEVSGKKTEFNIALPSELRGEPVLEIRGYKDDLLVAASRLNLEDVGIEP